MQKAKNLSVRRLVTSLLMVIAVLALMPQYTHAQWPPFSFRLTPLHANGQITYSIRFNVPRTIDWSMTNVRLNIPLPAGTRFVEAKVDPPAEVSFDGAEIRFFAASLPKRALKNASFTVEITDQTQIVFETLAWIGWEGDIPGNFLTNPIKIDTTSQTLDWLGPAKSRLRLDTVVTTEGNIITYQIYPKKGGSRMWDVNISLPIPAGTTLLSAEAPAPFQVGSNDSEVAFSVVELERRSDMPPLVVRLAADTAAGTPVVAQLWANWKNVGRSVGLTVPPEEATKSAEIIVYPGSFETTTIVDLAGEVPFANYDLTGVTLQQVLLPADGGSAVKVILRSAGLLGDETEPLQHTFYLDLDCQRETGDRVEILGAEYSILYRHSRARADLRIYNQTTKKWKSVTRLPVLAPADDSTITFWIPLADLQTNDSFCWLIKGRYQSTAYNPAPPTEYVPEANDLRLMKYTFPSQATVVETNFPALTTSKKKSSAKSTFIDDTASRDVGADTEVESESASEETGASDEPEDEETNTVFIPSKAEWRYLPGWSEPDETWKELEFDDSDWFTGPTRIGYGSGSYGSDLSLATPDQYQGEAPAYVFVHNPNTGTVVAVLPTGQERSVFMRRTFTVQDPADLDELTLGIKFRDGFVAYLNGVEVARRNMGRSESRVTFSQLATQRNRAKRPTVIDLSDYLSLLTAGENVLAIQVHHANRSTSLNVDVELR